MIPVHSPYVHAAIPLGPLSFATLALGPAWTLGPLPFPLALLALSIVPPKAGTNFLWTVKRNVVPLPTSLSTQMRPSYVSTMLLTLASPTPLPATLAL